MAQKPRNADVSTFLLEQHWSKANKTNAVSALNRAEAWMTEHRDVTLLGASLADITAYLDDRAEHVSAATVRIDWRYMRAFYAWASLDDVALVERNPMARLKGPRVPDSHVHRTVSEQEYKAVLLACRRTREVHRNTAMIALMYRAALRASEVIALDLSDLDLDADVPAVTIRSPKNNIVRRVPIVPEVQRLLRLYLRDRIGGRVGPLFTGTTNTGDSSGRLTYAGLKSMLDRVSEFSDVRVSAHAFRRGMAVDWLHRGGGETLLSHIAGWSDSRMVKRYARAGLDEAAALEMMRLHAPEQEVEDRRTARYRALQERRKASREERRT